MLQGIYGWARAQGALDRSSAALNSRNESGSQTNQYNIYNIDTQHGNEKEKVKIQGVDLGFSGNESATLRVIQFYNYFDFMYFSV